jgi:hypothetical protein
VRISRPCYDKMHRCPGWAGGGMLSAKVVRCDGGYIYRRERGDIYVGRWWRFRINRCPTCGVYVLPFAVRWLDPRWWRYKILR